MNEKILIIDDDKKLNSLLMEFLSSYNFTVMAATHPDEGMYLLKNNQPQIIILDIMLPHKDGFEVCREIRKDYNIPIIMLTARGDVADRIVGLELGADDYLPKPFEPRELVARIQSILRRSKKSTQPNKLSFKNLIIDFKKCNALVDGVDINLTTMEFEMLSLFAKNSGIVFDRDRIIEKLRGLDWDSFDRSIDVLVSRLRNKLKDNAGSPDFIKTVWGRGYMFVGDEKTDD
ncbi:response regulator [Spirochaetota bacterium]